MNAGELRDRITIQRNEPTYNTFNEPVDNWAEYATVWAAFKTTGTRELYYAQKVFPETAAVFRVRFRTDIDASMRVMLGTRVFQVLGVPYDPDGKRIELYIPAKEVGV